jgi:triacylglycerol esterase/lipase EstA (alpha/beta hydrolase family)
MGAARLHRAIVALLVGTAIALALAALAAGRPGWALAALTLPLALPAAVRAAEFTLLPWLHGDDPTPRARALARLRAWWRETAFTLVTFGAWQPFGHGAQPDHLPPQARGRRGVLLVHGFCCNRGLWNPWLARLRAAGVPCVAVDLQPVFAGIDDYVATVAAGVQRLREATGEPPLVVAHSMGGLAVRAWLAAGGRGSDVHAVLTLGTPHHGTWLAWLACSLNARQMRRGSDWLRALAAREADAGDPARFVCVWSDCDNLVMPPLTATLPGAEQRLLAGVGHLTMVYEPAVYALAQRLLAPPPAA